MLDYLYKILFALFIIIYLAKGIYHKKFSNYIDILSILSLFFGFTQNHNGIFPNIIILLTVVLIFFNTKKLSDDYSYNKTLKLTFISIVFTIIYASIIYFINYTNTGSFFAITALIKFLMCFYISINFVNSKNKLEEYIKIYIYIFFINLIISIIEINTGIHMSVTGNIITSGWNKNWPTSYFYNINDLCGYFVSMIPFIYYYFICVKKNKIIFIVLYLYIVYICILVQSYILIVVSICIFLYLILIKIYLKINKKLKPLIILGSITLLFMIFIYILYNINIFETNMKQRLLLAIKGFEIIKENIFGIGFGNFSNYNNFNNKIITLNYDVPLDTNIHNFFLDIIVSCGVGSIPFLITYCQNFCNLYKIKKYNADYVFIFSIIMFFISSMSSSTIVVSPIFWMWYIGILCYIKCRVR